MIEYFDCPFGLKGIKIPTYKDLSSPPKKEVEITVCATTWNRRKEIITQSIKSIFGQRFPVENYEVILVDDATEGRRVEDLRQAVDELIREYPNHNFRVYITLYTRCYNDPHILNVAFKRALGWILMVSQVDIVHVGETLESAWRHHNHLDKLWVCPKHYGEKAKGMGMEEAAPWSFAFFPHEFGSSVRKKYVDKIKGRNEKIIYEPPDVEFHVYLQKSGIIFGEDESVKTLHLYDAHNGCSRNFRPPAGNHNLNPPLIGRPEDKVWTQGDWGVLTSEEETKVIMSESMRRNLK